MKTLCVLCALCGCLAVGAADGALLLKGVDRENAGHTITASAVAVSKREVLTAAHNVLGDDKQPDKRFTWTIGGVRCELKKWDAETDLALLQADEDLAAGVVNLGGVAVTVVGSDEGAAVAGRLGELAAGEVDCAIRSGCSGGPVFIGGAFVGMIRAMTGDRKRTVFVALPAIRSFLNRRDAETQREK